MNMHYDLNDSTPTPSSDWPGSFSTSSNYSNRTPYDHQEFLENNLGPKHKHLAEGLSLTLVYSAIFISGVIGNVCTGVIVAKRPDMRTTTNCYLCSLAVSDIITLIVGLPTEVYEIWEAYPWIFGQTYCVLKTYFLDLTSSASVLTITAFTVERYFAIRYPLVAHTSSDANLRRVPGVIFLIWVAAGIISIPYPTHMAVDYELSSPETLEILEESLLCAIEKPWRDFYKPVLLFSFIFLFLIPITIITILYVLIAITISRSARARSYNQPGRGLDGSLSGHSHPTAASQSHKAVLKMLVAVVVAFFVCWAPFHAQRLMSAYINDWSTFLLAIHNGLFYVSGILYYFACTVNPILYNLMSRKYRQAFKETLCRSCWKSTGNLNLQRTSGVFRSATQYATTSQRFTAQQNNNSSVNNHYVDSRIVMNHYHPVMTG